MGMVGCGDYGGGDGGAVAATAGPVPGTAKAARGCILATRSVSLWLRSGALRPSEAASS